MTGKSREPLDPRILRTRRMLQHALETLLKKKQFDQVSVRDITEAATVNRATFYDHYPDKFALLECMVDSRFHALLTERGVRFEGSCASELRAIVLAVGTYLARMQGPKRKRQLEPHMESAIIAVVRRMLLDGLKQHPSGNPIAPETIAATASWAIYGAVKEWALTTNRCAPEDIADQVTLLVSPIFQLGQTPHSTM